LIQLLINVGNLVLAEIGVQKLNELLVQIDLQILDQLRLLESINESTLPWF